MSGAIEKGFGDKVPEEPIQWLTDNGSAYRAHETRQFARELNLSPARRQSAVLRVMEWQTVRENDEGRLHRVHAETECKNGSA